MLDRVRSLVLACTHPGAAHAVRDPEALALLADRGSLTPGQATEASIPFDYAATTPRERIEQDWAVRLPLACSPAGYLAQLQGSSAWSGLERLPSLRVPTLVLHGDGDRLVPPANGRRIAQAVPGAELVVLQNANHLFFTDQPDRTNDILLDWLARHRDQPGGVSARSVQFLQETAAARARRPGGPQPQPSRAGGPPNDVRSRSTGEGRTGRPGSGWPLARIPLVDSADEGSDPLARQTLEHVRALRGRAVDPDVYRAMADHPLALQELVEFGTVVSDDNSMSPAQRELASLSASVTNECHCRIPTHVLLGRAAGLTEDKLGHLGDDELPRACTSRTRLPSSATPSARRGCSRSTSGRTPR